MSAVNGYALILEPSATGYGAYCPDVLGCVATGATREEALEQYAEALAFHFEGLREDGEPIPEPTTLVATVDRPAAAA